MKALAALLALLTPCSVMAFAPARTMVPVTIPTSVNPSLSSPNFISSSFHAPASKLYMASASVAIEEPSDGNEASSGGDGTMTALLFNLVKSIVGAGVLSLPAGELFFEIVIVIIPFINKYNLILLSSGISAFGNAPSAMIPAAALIAVIGGLSGYGFSLIGRVCAFTNSNSYTEAWEKSISKKTGIIPAASCTFKTTCAILAYSMILADTFKQLFATIGFNFTRTNTLLGITSTVLLPLCLLKNLSSLAPFSLLGIVGMVYTAFAMGIRYFGGSYAAPAGVFLPDVAANFQPAFGSVGAAGVLSPNSFILICMLSTAYMSHFNAPKFYNELKDNTIKRYNILVGSSFAISIATFIIIAAFGFLTFGSSSSGVILNNYSNKDALMSLSRVAVAISLVFSYPLAFAGCRDGVLDLAKVPAEKRSNGLLNKVTVGILSAVTGLALTLKDVSFVASFAGATLGNALIYVYPALMFRGAVKKMGDKATAGLKREVKVAMANAALGVSMGAIGAKMALKSVLG